MAEISALDVGDRWEDTILGPFNQASIIAYANASHDHNPLHVDPKISAAAGFAAVPVHGMRLLAAVEVLLAKWRPDLRLKRLAGTFTQPLLVGETARLNGRVLRVEHSGSEILMRILIQGPRRGPSVVAEAVLTPRAESRMLTD
jgi:acyl dehydratase